MRLLLSLVLLVGGVAFGQEGVPDVSPPPLLQDSTPLVPQFAPQVDKGFLESVDRSLLAFRQEGFGLRLANKEKSLGVGNLFWDEDLEKMFVAVPEAMKVFQEARGKTFIASMLTLGGIIGVGGSLAVLGVFLLLPTASLPLLIAALVLDIAALVVTMISIPFRMRAQSGLFEAVELHNRGLLKLPQTPAPTDGPVVMRF